MNLETTFPAPGADEHDPRPMVAMPRSGIPGMAIAIVAIISAIALFFVLDGRRQRAAGEELGNAGPATAFASPPPLIVPREAQAPVPQVILYPAPPQPGRGFATPQRPQALPAPVAQPDATTAYPAFAQPVETQPMPAPFELPQPMPPAPAPNDGPAVVIGSGQAHGATGQMLPKEGGNTGPAQQAGNQGAAVPSVKMSQIADPANVMPVGTLIPAVLETPIDTARPGLVRAIVSRDARGFGGRNILVPKGSRLIGEYQSEIGAGQNRVMVSWTRVIRPDGMTITLAAPATDAAGATGVPGRVNSFFFSRVLGAVFQSALAIGENLASSRTSTVIVGVPNGAVTNVAGQSLVGSQGPRRKITVKPGTLVNVFVAQDLDFSAAPVGS